MACPRVAVDLGTGYAQIAVLGEDGRPRILRNRWGSLQTPSYVAYSEQEGWLAGEEACRKVSPDSGRSWRDVKRHLGKDWTVEIEGEHYRPEELLVPLLELLREDMEAELQSFVSSCVLTVPAHFSFPERAAMVRAARRSGFDTVRIVNEPTAAAIAVGQEGRFLILDFGAGTLDVSVVEQEDNVWQVVETQGYSNIGGNDLDLLIARWLALRLGDEELSEEGARRMTLLAEAERLKRALTESGSVTWYPPRGLLAGVEPAEALEVTRREMEERVAEPVRRIVRLAGRFWRRYRPDRLILVGGSSRLPLLRRMLEAEVAPPEHAGFCPDEAVVTGAALIAGDAGRHVLLDVLARDLGIETVDGTVATLLEKGTPLPASSVRSFRPSGRGVVTVPVVQGASVEQWKRTRIGAVRFEPGSVDEVDVRFSVDSGGVLTVEALVAENTLVHQVLDLPGVDEEEDARQQIEEIKMRLARISPWMGEGQQQMLDELFGLYQLAQADWRKRPEALRLLGEMTERLEGAVRR